MSAGAVGRDTLRAARDRRGRSVTQWGAADVARDSPRARATSASNPDQDDPRDGVGPGSAPSG